MPGAIPAGVVLVGGARAGGSTVPEGIEAELYRRAAAETVGRTIAAVDVDDHQDEAVAIAATLPGRTITATDRHGKVVTLDLASPNEGPVTLGLHFGMTGRLIVDDVAAIERLEYASGRDDPAWNRLTIVFDGGGRLRVNDPRRWACFVLEPDLDRLGVDVFAVTQADLAAVCRGRRRALKAVLLDQALVAGYGNMCVDEVLWHAGLSPVRPAGSLSGDELGALADVTRRRLGQMLTAGGSHTGTISPEVRAAVPPCPLDSTPLRREQVGGRTTIWCPAHQPAGD